MLDYGTVEEWLDGEADERIAAGEQGLLPFGLAPLDDAFGGIAHNDLVMVAAPTGGGKSSLLGTISEAVVNAGYSVFALLLEGNQRDMERQVLYRRAAIMAKRSGGLPRGLSYRSWRSGQITLRAEDEAARSMQQWGDRWMTAYAGRPMGPSQVLGTLKGRRDVSDLLVLDHLSQVAYSGGGREFSEQATLARELQLMAKKTAVVAAVQFRKDPRGSLYDLVDVTGSGAIIQAPTLLLGLLPCPDDLTESLQLLKGWPPNIKPCFISVWKDRFGGAWSERVLVGYDVKIGAYLPDYEVGWLRRETRNKQQQWVWRAAKNPPEWAAAKKTEVANGPF